MLEWQEHALVSSLESLAIDIKRIADSLEVMAGAKTINEIRHNIVPGSEVELFDGSFAAQVYCNVQKEENSINSKTNEEGQAPDPDRNTTASGEG